MLNNKYKDLLKSNAFNFDEKKAFYFQFLSKFPKKKTTQIVAISQ